MDGGNAAIQNHSAEKRALRVFDGVGGTVTYVDEFQLDEQVPWYQADAPEIGGGPLRKVIVFRFQPMSIKAVPPDSQLTRVLEGILEDAPSDQRDLEGHSAAIVQSVPVEERHTEKSVVEPSREPYESERRESKLVENFKRYLQDRGHIVTRHRILPPGEHKPIFTDVYDHTADLLIEAKGTVTRDAIRMAIGQLADYARFLPTATCIMLVPERPRVDLVTLCQSQGIAIVWPTGRSFSATQAGLLPA
jgi:hypothetical protein